MVELYAESCITSTVKMQKSAFFHERLKFRRNALDWSQPDLAHKSGVSQRSIADYEGGDTDPGLENVEKLARALGVTVAWLVGEDLPGMLRDKPSHLESGGRMFALLETDTLLRTLAETTAKLPAAAPRDRKYIIGNIRAMLDEIEEREIKPVSSVSLDPAVEEALRLSPVAKRAAQESARTRKAALPTDKKP